MRALDSNLSSTTSPSAVNMSLCTEPFTDVMFTVGSLVECCTLHQEILTGEVVAFEYDTKILVLKSPSANGQTNSDITCINLDLCSDIKIVKESPDPSLNTSKLPEINTQKIDERLRNAVKERRNLIEAYKSGAGVDGIHLYFSLLKTIGESVSWETNEHGQCITIGKNIKIRPPYNADCLSLTNKASMSFAENLLKKFWLDQNKDPYTLAPLKNSGSGGGGGGDNSRNCPNTANTANSVNTTSSTSLSSSTSAANVTTSSTSSSTKTAKTDRPHDLAGKVKGSQNVVPSVGGRA